jgi:flagellar export protein FliJ
MAKPKSRLQLVLRIKKYLEKKAHGELVKIQVARVRENETLDQLEKVRETALDDAGKALKTSATALQTEHAYITTISKQVAHQKTKVQDLQGQEDVKRKELVERSQSKRIVETLEEKKAMDEIKEVEKKHQRLIDMLAQRVRFEI